MAITCVQCGSDDIVKRVRIIDHGDNDWKRDLKVEVYEDPNAFIFKGTHEGKLSANVCADCGYVMLSVSPRTARELKRVQKRAR